MFALANFNMIKMFLFEKTNKQTKDPMMIQPKTYMINFHDKQILYVILS